MTPQIQRNEAIDTFRGFAIVSMVWANYIAGVNIVPGWLKHAPDIGLTVIDVIAPWFIFAIGLTYRQSAVGRAEHSGVSQTVQHFVRRYLAIAGIGALIAAGEQTFGVVPPGVGWGVLQAIGFAGLLVLPLIFSRPVVRLVMGCLILAGYQFFLDHFWLESVLRTSHGGLQGTLGWGAMLLLSTVLADLFHEDRSRAKDIPLKGFLLGRFLLVSVGMLGVGLLLSAWLPISKHRVSLTYVLISTGISALVFYVFYLVDRVLDRKLPLLPAWGKNPLLLYCLHLVLLGLVVLPGSAAWYADAPLWLVLLQLFALLGVLSAIAVRWERKGFVFSM